MLPSLPVSASNARRNEASVSFSGVVPALAEAVGLGPPRPGGGIGTGLRVIDAEHNAPSPRSTQSPSWPGSWPPAQARLPQGVGQ